MKKFVIISAALLLTAGSFAQSRLASAQPPAPTPEQRATDAATSAQPGPEAFIDLIRAFKELHGFNQQMSAIKDGIRKFDLDCKEQQSKLNALRDELEATNEAGRRLQLEKELADRQAKLRAQIAETRQQFLVAEAKIYNEVYDQVQAAVAEYAKEHGIRRVTRSQSVARVEDKVDGSDRTAVLARVNRPIVYLAAPSESPSDITDAILERLNSTKTR